MQLRNRLQRGRFWFKDDAATSGKKYREKCCRIIRAIEKREFRKSIREIT